MNIEQMKNDILDCKIESFSTLNFHKIVFIHYKNAPCVCKGPFDNVDDFYEFLKFLKENNIKYLGI